MCVSRTRRKKSREIEFRGVMKDDIEGTRGNLRSTWTIQEYMQGNRSGGEQAGRCNVIRKNRVDRFQIDLDPTGLRIDRTCFRMLLLTRLG